MIDSFSGSIWLTDAVLLGLAYSIGRVHGRFLATELYRQKLDELIEEVKGLRRKVNSMVPPT